MSYMALDFYEISDFEIDKLAATKNPYWMKVRDFWWQVREMDIRFLSRKQNAWLSSIEEELYGWREEWMAKEGVELVFD